MITSPDSAELFDVREIPCRVKHGQIFQKWLDLPVGRAFVLVNDHDPVPLYYQFEAQFGAAFRWEYVLRGPEEFQVRITKLKAVAAPPTLAKATCGSHERAVSGFDRHVDARGLEPPEPLMLILNALETLPEGGRLNAHTDRQPCHLYGEAEQRGFRHQSAEQADGSWITVLERR